jgi:hypothetical protein
VAPAPLGRVGLLDFFDFIAAQRLDAIGHGAAIGAVAVIAIVKFRGFAVIGRRKPFARLPVTRLIMP